MIAAITGLMYFIRKLVDKYKTQKKEFDRPDEIPSVVNGPNGTVTSFTDHNRPTDDTGSLFAFASDKTHQTFNKQPDIDENQVPSSVVIVDMENDEQPMEAWRRVSSQKRSCT